MFCLQAELAAAKPLEPQEQQGASFTHEKPDRPRPGPSQLAWVCSSCRVTCPREAAKKAGPLRLISP